MNPGPPLVGLPISPLAHLLLADLEDDVHAGAHAAITEGTDPDGEQLSRDRSARDLEIVDVTSVNGAHDARRVRCRRREYLYRVGSSLGTIRLVALEELYGRVQIGQVLAAATDGDLDGNDTALLDGVVHTPSFTLSHSDTAQPC
jgi:hypothetical protein